MAQTEGLRAEGRRVEWTLTPEQARQLATIVEMTEADPFLMADEIAYDLRRAANAATQNRAGATALGPTP